MEEVRRKSCSCYNSVYEVIEHTQQHRVGAPSDARSRMHSAGRRFILVVAEADVNGTIKQPLDSVWDQPPVFDHLQEFDCRIALNGSELGLARPSLFDIQRGDHSHKAGECTIKLNAACDAFGLAGSAGSGSSSRGESLREDDPRVGLLVVVARHSSSR